MSLATALEQAASALPADADAIRPANGDPTRLLQTLESVAATRVLAWLLTHEAEAGAELADAWAEEERGAPALAGVEEEALPKAGRKALRRALHRLRARGVALPERPKTPVVAALPRIEDELESAFLSAFDPAGARMGVLIEPHPGGGARIFELVLDPGRGVVDCNVYTTGRSEARRFARALEARERFPGVTVSPGALRAFVARVAQHQLPDRSPPRAFDEWRSRLAVPPEGARTPGAEVREALGEPTDAEALRAAVALVERREVGPWPPAEAALRATAEKLRDAMQAKIIVSGAQRRERADAVLRESLAEVYDAPAAEAAALRFEETAFVRWKTGSEDDARACLAAARAFRERPAAENPVARALLEALLAPLLRSLQEEEASSLIVKP